MRCRQTDRIAADTPNELIDVVNRSVGRLHSKLAVGAFFNFFHLNYVNSHLATAYRHSSHLRSFVQFDRPLANYLGQIFIDRMIERAQHVVVTNKHVCFRAELSKHTRKLNGNVAGADDNRFPKISIITLQQKKAMK